MLTPLQRATCSLPPSVLNAVFCVLTCVCQPATAQRKGGRSQRAILDCSALAITTAWMVLHPAHTPHPTSPTPASNLCQQMLHQRSKQEGSNSLD